MKAFITNSFFYLYYLLALHDHSITYLLVFDLPCPDVLVICAFLFDSQRKAYSGCLGKTFRFTSGQYTFAGSTHLRCVILSMGSGAVIVLVVAKITTLGIKTLSFD